MKRSVRKGCKVFVFYIMNGNENDNKRKLEEIPFLKEFENVFLEEVPGLGTSSKTIDLRPKVVPTSKAPY